MSLPGSQNPTTTLIADQFDYLKRRIEIRKWMNKPI